MCVNSAAFRGCLTKTGFTEEKRHTYVAHNDENEFETVTVREEEAPGKLMLHLQYAISFPFDRLYELRKLIRLVELHIVDRQKGHLAAIEREVGKPVRLIEGNTDTACGYLGNEVHSSREADPGNA